MKVNLLVLRTTRLEELREFYTLLGAQFEVERHGTGPEHYAAVLNSNLIFELYPSNHIVSSESFRFGVEVNNLRETLQLMGQDIEPRQTRWGLRAVVTDPDGRRVEILESESARLSNLDLLAV